MPSCISGVALGCVYSFAAEEQPLTHIMIHRGQTKDFPGPFPAMVTTTGLGILADGRNSGKWRCSTVPSNPWVNLTLLLTEGV